MPQLNMNMTAQFKSDLAKYMKHRGLKTKSEAVRMALHELVTLLSSAKKSDFGGWLGAGLKTGLRKDRQFKSEDDLWRTG